MTVLSTSTLSLIYITLCYISFAIFSSKDDPVCQLQALDLGFFGGIFCLFRDHSHFSHYHFFNFYLLSIFLFGIAGPPNKSHVEY